MRALGYVEFNSRRTAAKSNQWLASKQLMDECRLGDRASVIIKFGSYSHSINMVRSRELSGLTLEIPVSVQKYVPFLLGRRYFASWDKNRLQINIGPLIAILTADSLNSKKGKPFHGRTHFFKEIIQYASKQGALVCMLTPQGLVGATNSCYGYIMTNTGWRKVKLPLPDVVYNRVPSRILENRSDVVTAKRKLLQLSIPMFNPHFLNKWDLHKILTNSQVTEILPATQKFRDFNQVDGFLSKYGAVYLKPLHSFAGKGIIKVSKKSSGYVVQYRQNNRNIVNRFGVWTQTARYLNNVMEHKNYIVQQGLDLARYQGRIFDARILVQRDKEGKWRFTGAGCRVAGKGGITTHVPNGGSIAPIKSVLQDVFGEKWDMIFSKIKQAALTVPVLIEKHYSKEFGIMSMDIGIDKKGDIWFFEANAKPMEFDERITQTKSLIRLVHYCRCLAGFIGGRGGA